MTVEELITELQSFPPSMRVVARGYESGWDDIEEIKALELYHVPDNPGYEGKYQNSNWENKPYDKSDIVTIF